MSHPADQLKGQAKSLYTSLHDHGTTVVSKGAWRVVGSILLALAASVTMYFIPPVGAFVFFVAALLQFNGAYLVWRGMQYFAAANSVIVHHQFPQAVTSPVTHASFVRTDDDAYDHSQYAEIACTVDVQQSPITPLPGRSYPCDIEAGGNWRITSPIGRVIVADGSQLDFDAIKGGKARLETSNKLDLDSHGRLKATLAMPRRRLVSNADAA